jgi:hypothetical protein
MKSVVLIIGTVFLFSTLALAGGPKTYQVTGPVLDVKDDTVTVLKGKDKWEIAKDAGTNVVGDLKVGSKVTIEYTMTAKSIEAKDVLGKKAKEAGKKADMLGKKAEDAGKKAMETGKDAKDAGNKAVEAGKDAKDAGNKAADEFGK